MRYCMAFIGLVFFSCTVFAQHDVLTGFFGHNYTDKKDDPVWEIKTDQNDFLMVTLSDQSQEKVHLFTEKERGNFWERMMWPKQSSLPAQCIGNKKLVICHVPAEIRKQIDWIANNISDYFYYDSFLGVTEIRHLR